ncbi:hypothetical protein A33M_0375 [Rhodovulum sp. PH10]|uniref:hypothetical protein n=1 Tax=Rhodovulum sp. PH10 TaxID=1187851 RepID=UPI00027C2589|nr:hypothetical protein [Rhodovulum sp. PH10]EJW10205.1 hypothetical protein A33M_0375 [Rhodovulum sp. PH10]
MVEAENLGDATAQASKAAREAFAATAPSRDGTRIEPHVEPEGLRPPPRRSGLRLPEPHEPPFPGAPLPPPIPGAPRADARPGGRRDGRLEGRAEGGPEGRTEPPPTGWELGAPTPQPGAPRDAAIPVPPPYPSVPGAAAAVPAEALDYAGQGGVQGSVQGGVRPYLDDRDADDGDRPFPLAPEPQMPLPPDDRDRDGELRPLRPSLGARLLPLLIALLVVGGIGGAAWWAWPSLSKMVSGGTETAQKAPAPAPAPPPVSGKITDRVGSQPSPETRQEVPAVAQRVVLYEEDPGDPNGKRYVGTAVWRTETIVAAPGQTPDLVVRADIAIPERNTAVKFSLRRNTDKSLPASHTIEIMFTLPPENANGGIQNIPGVLMKQAEQTRGVPLAGLAVKVTDGFFLIGLSSTDTDMQRNLALLKERGWFDVPIVYANGRRAIMAIEKGTPGDRAFAEAFKAWGQ